VSALEVVGCAQGSRISDVPSQAQNAQLFLPTRILREVVALMDCAEERAGHEDVGEQALMRGLDTAFPFVRLGLSLSNPTWTMKLDFGR
jgi:hypothetical protein